MPRFVEYFLRFLSHTATVVIGVVVLAMLVFVYNRPRAQTGPPQQSYAVKGLSPSEDAGILGGIAAQRAQMETMRREVETLRASLEKMERQPTPKSDAKTTALLQQQLRALRAQMEQSAQQRVTRNVTGVAPPAPPVTLRIIGQAAPGGNGKPGQTPTNRIHVAGRDPQHAGAETAPYLPPQSFALGRVKDGYTGLASLETFPVTLEITSAFSAPNGHTVPLTGCRLGATATPEELTARGRLSLTKLTCVTPSGQTIEGPVAGYITAADNINGQIAKVFWHERDVVSAFGKGAVPVALVSLFRETRRVVDVATLTGVVVSSGNSVAQQVALRMANLYLDKAEKLASPIIWVGPNTPVYIYITEGARLEGLHTVASQSGPLARRMMR